MAAAILAELASARDPGVATPRPEDRRRYERSSRLPVDGTPGGPRSGGAQLGQRSERSDRADDEARLLQEVAGGSQAAYRILVEQHLRALLSIGRRMLGESHEAEDMAQEALLRLWRSAGQIEIGASGVKPWLYRVASNLCLDRLRARKSSPQLRDELPERGTAPTQLRAIEETELGLRVEQAMQQLPDRQRMALVLFHYQGLSQEEAARTLGISEDALESLLSRARRSLKAALAEEWKSLLPEDREPEGNVGWKAGSGHAD